MPKKGKKGKKSGKGKGKGKKGKKDKLSAKGEEDIQDDPFVDKEELMKEEYAKVCQDVEEAKKELEDLRKENEWLQDEAQRIRVESHEYMSYMEKKVDKRQRTIITLSDYNQQEIRELQRMKDEMLNAYEEKKSELRNILLEKEANLANAKQDLEDLQEYKRLKDEQTTRIKELEKEIQHLRARHSDQLQSLKAQFLREKREFEEESDMKVQELAKEAYKEATTCLAQHTNKIKSENRSLRRELLFMIQQTRSLHEHRRKLEEQKKELLREQQFSRDLRRLRNTRHQKMMRAYGIEDHDIMAEVEMEDRRTFTNDDGDEDGDDEIEMGATSSVFSGQS